MDEDILLLSVLFSIAIVCVESLHRTRRRSHGNVSRDLGLSSLTEHTYTYTHKKSESHFVIRDVRAEEI